MVASGNSRYAVWRTVYALQMWDQFKNLSRFWSCSDCNTIIYNKLYLMEFLLWWWNNFIITFRVWTCINVYTYRLLWWRIMDFPFCICIIYEFLIHLEQGRNETHLATTNCVIIMILVYNLQLSIFHFPAWTLIYTCTEECPSTRHSTRVLVYADTDRFLYVSIGRPKGYGHWLLRGSDVWMYQHLMTTKGHYGPIPWRS